MAKCQFFTSPQIATQAFRLVAVEAIVGTLCGEVAPEIKWNCWAVKHDENLPRCWAVKNARGFWIGSVSAHSVAAQDRRRMRAPPS